VCEGRFSSYRHARGDVVKVPELHPCVVVLLLLVVVVFGDDLDVWRRLVVEESQPHDGVVVAGRRRVLVGEVDLGLGSPDAARGGLGGGEGAEPDARALGRVADLRRPLAPRPPPDAAVHRLALTLPRRRCKGRSISSSPVLVRWHLHVEELGSTRWSWRSASGWREGKKMSLYLLGGRLLDTTTRGELRLRPEVRRAEAPLAATGRAPRDVLGDDRAAAHR
jgi:hypothetical protein